MDDRVVETEDWCRCLSQRTLACLPVSSEFVGLDAKLAATTLAVDIPEARMRQRELGACFAYSKSDGNAYVFHRSEYPRLKADWMAGKAFFEGRGFYGSVVIVKLGDIIGVIDEIPDAMAACRADKAEDKKEDEILGL